MVLEIPTPDKPNRPVSEEKKDPQKGGGHQGKDGNSEPKEADSR